MFKGFIAKLKERISERKKLEEFFPQKESIAKREKHKGFIEEVYTNTARVTIHQKWHQYKEDYFPLNLFKVRMPVAGCPINYHIWQLKNGSYGGFFEVLEPSPLRLSRKDRKVVEEILNKWKEDLKYKNGKGQTY
jgi:hypothetical protein